MLEKLPVLENDELITLEVGPWAEYKYRLVWNYTKMFTTSMKSKWDALVYIDLFAGSGRSKIKNTSKIVPGSPLLALNITDKFNKYIFCDKAAENIQALKERTNREYPNIDISFTEADVNANIEKILSEVPQHKKGFKVLSFCFADPYKIKNLHFRTIKELSSRFIDFLILIPSYMDAHRNIAPYLNQTNSLIENFTGVKDWRIKWKSAESKRIKFGSFISDIFGDSMKKLNYSYNGLSDMVQIRSHDNNLPLYHLAFFSRSKLGVKFWEESKKYSNDQLNIFD